MVVWIEATKELGISEKKSPTKKDKDHLVEAKLIKKQNSSFVLGSANVKSAKEKKGFQQALKKKFKLIKKIIDKKRNKKHRLNFILINLY